MNISTPELLAHLLRRNGCSLTKTAKAIGKTPQRVHQMMGELGVRITKTATTASERKALRSRVQ